ncbi:glutaredoxin family protein [Citrifermentans bremense]|uniref:glutaredoxin family protein n=1 Tax=Citrifermentans bremense TaxID=60035 RepID=UPI00041EC6EC|nr:hypothetical protein [Citrifermentans bremense]
MQATIFTSTIIPSRRGRDSRSAAVPLPPLSHRLRCLARFWLAACLALLLLLPPGARAAASELSATLYFFWGVGCPHCTKAKPFLEELKRKYPTLRIESYEVLEKRENIPLLVAMARARHKEATGVPVFIIGQEMFSGFSAETAAEVEQAVRLALQPVAPQKQAAQKPAPTPPVRLPLLGPVDAQSLSLPVFTVAVALLDSFNPCAFFVLFFLLSLLIHAHSRRRMLLIGGLFVFFSGLVYFVFMAAWLNLFLLTGGLPAITFAAGIVALFVGAVNVKEFFYFGQGVSLSIPEQQKPKLFARMRRLLRADSLPCLLAGTTVLALAANSYELLCTAGFPMVFTRMLTLRELPTYSYYAYLAFYCTIYALPLAVIVALFTVKLGERKLTQWQGRVLKLVSGLMMLGLGLVLLIDPALLNNPLASAALLAGTLAAAALLAAFARKRGAG